MSLAQCRGAQAVCHFDLNAHGGREFGPRLVPEALRLPCAEVGSREDMHEYRIVVRLDELYLEDVLNLARNVI